MKFTTVLQGLRAGDDFFLLGAKGLPFFRADDRVEFLPGSHGVSTNPKAHVELPLCPFPSRWVSFRKQFEHAAQPDQITLEPAWLSALHPTSTSRDTSSPNCFIPLFSPRLLVGFDNETPKQIAHGDTLWQGEVGVRSNAGAIYRRTANGGGKEEILLEGDNSNRVLADWSPDGKSLLFVIGDMASTGEIWLAPLIGERKPVPLVQGNFVAAWPRFSPDGHWIAYSSTESGSLEVYVIPFGGGAGKWQISSTGGTQPVWRRDGGELFYWSADHSLMSVSLSLKSGVVEAGSARILSRWNNPVGNIGISSALDVSNDGQRFVAVSVGPQPSRPIALVTNWDTDLKK